MALASSCGWSTECPWPVAMLWPSEGWIREDSYWASLSVRISARGQRLMESIRRELSRLLPPRVGIAGRGGAYRLARWQLASLSVWLVVARSTAELSPNLRSCSIGGIDSMDGC